MNDSELEQEVPNQALRELAELNLRDGWPDGMEWDQLEPTDQTELLCLACEKYGLNWEEYRRNYPPPSPFRRRALKKARLRKG